MIIKLYFIFCLGVLIYCIYILYNHTKKFNNKKGSKLYD